MKTPKQILEDCCGYTQRDQSIDPYDDITDAGIATLGTAEHLDAQNGLRAGIVSNF